MGDFEAEEDEGVAVFLAAVELLELVFLAVGAFLTSDFSEVGLASLFSVRFSLPRPPAPILVSEAANDWLEVGLLPELVADEPVGGELVVAVVVLPVAGEVPAFLSDEPPEVPGETPLPAFIGLS